MDGFVEWYFAIFAGEEVVTVVVTQLLAVATRGYGTIAGEDGEPVFALEYEGVHVIGEVAIRVALRNEVEGKTGGGGEERG